MSDNSTTDHKLPSKKRPWLNWYDFVWVIAIVTIIHFWQTRDSLDTSGEIEAPNFVLPTLSDQTVDSSERFNAPTVYYFFAPWCNICHLSIENLNELKSNIETQQVNLFIIALDWQSKAEVEKFVSEHELPVNVLLGTHQLREQFQIKGYPTYYIADSNGSIKWASVGYSTGLGIRARLQFAE